MVKAMPVFKITGTLFTRKQTLPKWVTKRPIEQNDAFSLDLIIQMHITASYKLNTVRVPIGWWIIGYDNHDPSNMQDWKTFAPGGKKATGSFIAISIFLCV